MGGVRTYNQTMSATDTELTARVPVTPETRDRLAEMKTGRDRYEEVINRLIDQVEKHEKE